MLAKFEFLIHHKKVVLEHFALAIGDIAIYHMDKFEVNCKLSAFSCDQIEIEIPDHTINCLITIYCDDIKSNLIFHIPFTPKISTQIYRLIFWSSDTITLNVGNTICSERLHLCRFNPKFPNWDTKKDSNSPTEFSDKYLRRLLIQYTYRYIVLHEHVQHAFDLKVLNVYNCDGTFDKTNDGKLMRFHTTCIPQKLGMQWKIGRIHYSLYCWMAEDDNSEIFSRFYGAHPDTKSDFIIRIDPENRKYELALYRQGLKEPVIIPQSAYQLIVFKNKFEDYRSENYDQPRGAWIW